MGFFSCLTRLMSRYRSYLNLTWSHLNWALVYFHLISLTERVFIQSVPPSDADRGRRSYFTQTGIDCFSLLSRICPPPRHSSDANLLCSNQSCEPWALLPFWGIDWMPLLVNHGAVLTGRSAMVPSLMRSHRPDIDFKAWINHWRPFRHPVRSSRSVMKYWIWNDQSLDRQVCFYF